MQCSVTIDLMQQLFRKFSSKTSEAVGSSWAFIIAALVIVVWIISGPFFKFSDTWQLVINTGTTIITFLMVFLIQNAQNRDSKATHLKLDELIYSVKGARNTLIDAEDLSDEEIQKNKDRLLLVGKRKPRNKASKKHK